LFRVARVTCGFCVGPAATGDEPQEVMPAGRDPLAAGGIIGEL
jgi:hypothetical protein